MGSGWVDSLTDPDSTDRRFGASGRVRAPWVVVPHWGPHWGRGPNVNAAIERMRKWGRVRRLLFVAGFSLLWASRFLITAAVGVLVAVALGKSP